MNASVIFITPDRWLIVSIIFFALSFFMVRRIPLIVAGTAFTTSAVSFIYPFLVNTGPLSSPLQICLFSVLLILGLLFIHIAPATASSSLKKGDSLILVSPIQNGEGTLTVSGIPYTLIGPDCAEGTQVHIMSIQGTTLYVNPTKR